MTDKDAPEATNADQPDFEAALEELEQLVERMESGELPLEDSLASFRRGVDLTRRCQLVLDRAQQTVDQLLDHDDETSAAPLPGSGPDAND